MRLTQEQQRVIDARDSRILVNAFAGTGKTETTAHRVASLRNEGKRVLLLCFTRAAQKQLKERLEKMGVHVKVSTLHSFAHDLIRQWYKRNDAEMPSLVGDFMLRELIQRHGFNATGANVEAIRRASTFIANGMTTGFPQSSEFDGPTARMLVEKYAHEKELLNRVDYDDLISMATELVNPWKGEIVVDEAQDLSNLQLKLLDALTGPETTVSWIGDRWQSIYSFAGVDSQLFASKSDWTEYTLSESFRSSREVLTVANQLVPQVINSNITGGAVDVRAKDTADTISDLMEWVKGNDVILARTNSELQHIAAHFTYEKVPYLQTAHEANDAYVSSRVRPTVLSTIHAAKGLEWDRVAVIGLNRRGFGQFDISAEEARLFYVASTRAKSQLTLYTTDGLLPFDVEVENHG